MVMLFLMEVFFVVLNGIAVKAQSSNWLKPVSIFHTQEMIFTPVLISDTSGKLHLLWRYVISPTENKGPSFDLIFYSQWDGVSWSEPVDIIAWSSLRSLSATVDRYGTIHLVWTDPENLYYSRATVDTAKFVKSWAKPLTLEQANPNIHLLADDRGRLHLVYAGKGTAGVYYLFSENNGATWSVPRKISGTSSQVSSAVYTYLAIGKNRTLHVVWTELQLPEGWPPLGVYYTRSSDGGLNWSRAVEMAGEGYDQINIVSDGNGIIHVAWNGMVGVDGRYHRWSADDGQTWSETETIVPDGATSGPPWMVIDSAGTLHLLTTYSCAWYLSWTESSRWNLPDCISQEEAKKTKYIEEAVLMISEGNQLHAVFWAERQRLWYTAKNVLSPAEPPVPFLTQTIMTIPASTPGPNIITGEELSLTPVSPIQQPGIFIQPIGPGQIISISAIPIIIIIISIIVRHMLIQRGNFQ